MQARQLVEPRHQDAVICHIQQIKSIFAKTMVTFCAIDECRSVTDSEHLESYRQK